MLHPMQVHPQPHSTKKLNSLKPKGYRYRIVILEELPVLDLSQTVLRRVFKASPQLHNQLSQFIDAHIGLIYAMYAVGCMCASACFLAKDLMLQTAFAVVSFVLTVPFILIYVVLNAQMALLVMQLYDFWFLVFATTVLFATMAKIVMPNAWRVLACAHIWLGAIVQLFSDGTPQFRADYMRLLIVGAPCVLMDVFAVMARYVEPANYTNFFAGSRVSFQDTDLVLNCTIIIAIFNVFRFFMNREWLCPVRDQVKVVRCQTYRPCHGMVQLNMPSAMLVTRNVPKRKLCKSTVVVSPLESFQQPITPIPLLKGFVDARRTLFDIKASLSPLSKWVSYVLHGCGICGIVLTCVSFGTAITATSLASGPLIACLGLICTAVFCYSSILYFQRDLAILILCEIDVWFASVQFAVLTVCLMDMLCWDSRMLFCGSFLIWYHWVICADALPPISKDILGFHRRFMLLVIVIIMMYLVALFVWLGFQDQITDSSHICGTVDSSNSSSSSKSASSTPWLSTPSLASRVLVHYGSKDGTFYFQMESISVFTSKLVTCLLWIARLLWREMFRPRDAFRMIRSRVQYRVPLSWNS